MSHLICVETLLEPRLKGRESEGSELTYVVDGLYEILEHLCEKLNSCEGDAPGVRILPKLKEFISIIKKIVEFLTSAPPPKRGEIMTFNETIQKQLLKGWSEEFLHINPRALDFSKKVPVTHLTLYVCIKLIFFTLGFDLNKTCCEFVDMVENSYHDIALYSNSPEFLTCPLGKSCETTFSQFAICYFEYQKDWFLDLANANGVMYEFYKKEEKTGKMLRDHPDHAPLAMLPSKV